MQYQGNLYQKFSRNNVQFQGSYALIFGINFPGNYIKNVMIKQRPYISIKQSV
jgi:hypothetical protein